MPKQTAKPPRISRPRHFTDRIIHATACAVILRVRRHPVRRVYQRTARRVSGLGRRRHKGWAVYSRSSPGGPRRRRSVREFDSRRLCFCEFQTLRAQRRTLLSRNMCCCDESISGVEEMFFGLAQRCFRSDECAG